MKTTRVLLLLAAALLVAVPAYNTVWAAQRGPAAEAQQARGDRLPGYGWQHPAIAPEQQAAYEKIITEYRAKAQPLHNDMWAKRTELEYLARGDKAEARDISKLVSDMKSLREKMQALQESTAAKLAKDLNITSEHAYALLGGGGCGAGARGMMGPCADGPRGGMGPCGDGPRGGWHGGGHRGWHR